jgi:hypothetical protein
LPLFAPACALCGLLFFFNRKVRKGLRKPHKVILFFTLDSHIIHLSRKFRLLEHADYYLASQETELLKLLIEGHYKKLPPAKRKFQFTQFRFI